LCIGFDPKNYTIAQKKNLVVRATDYQLIVGHLYKLGAENILGTCVMDHEHPIILVEAHEGIARGHFVGKSTVKNILRAKLWWPTVSKDTKEYFQACDVYQRVENSSMRDEMPLRP
jgi:hypothetical protein